MSVGRICVRDVDTAEPQEAVWCVAERMHQRAVGSLVVVNDLREPVGMLTDRDLVERVIAAARDPQTTLVRDVMTAAPQTVYDDAAIEAALELMRCKAVRRLPVVDAQGKLVGLLSVDDVMSLLAEEMTSIGRLLERQTPRAYAEM